MAQGSSKMKNPHKKEKLSRKPLGPTKGRKHIAPKKSKTINERKVKLQLTKAINNTIEQELASKAGTGMKVINVPKTDPKPEKKKKTKR